MIFMKKVKKIPCLGAYKIKNSAICFEMMIFSSKTRKLYFVQKSRSHLCPGTAVEEPGTPRPLGHLPRNARRGQGPIY